MEVVIKMNSLAEFVKVGKILIEAADNGQLDEDLEFLDAVEPKEEPKEEPKAEAKPKKAKKKAEPKEEPKVEEPAEEEVIAPTEEVIEETVEEETVEEETEAEETVEEITDDQMRKAIITCGKTYSREVLVEILGLYGVKVASDVPQNKRAEAIRKLEAGDVNA